MSLDQKVSTGVDATEPRFRETYNKRGHYCIEVQGLSQVEVAAIRSIVTNTDSTSDDYRLSREANAFWLVDSRKPDTAIVEFWGRNHAAFVDHLNQVFDARVEELRSSGVDDVQPNAALVAPRFVVSKGCHDMDCIEATGLTKYEVMAVRSFVLNNWIDTDDYKYGKLAGAFMQGEDERSGWILVEFWSDNFVPFVDHVNRNFAQRVADMIEIHGEEEQHG